MKCSDRNAPRESGFTLIEVLAALLIFSLSIVGLTHAGMQSTRSAAAIEMKSLASIVADNQLIVARTARLQTGTQSGQSVQMGIGFDYSLITEETEQDGLYRISVTVNRQDEAQTLITRTAFRIDAR